MPSCRRRSPRRPANRFPYTTLFRSLRRVQELVERPVVVLTHPARVGWVSTTTGRDRKSTRLNSSHVAISYAAFCLKKKKIKSRMHEHTMKFYSILNYNTLKTARSFL